MFLVTRPIGACLGYTADALCAIPSGNTRSCSIHGVKVYLGVTEVAVRTGLAVNTIKFYSQDTPRRMPKPDAMIGRVKGWKAETIDEWRARSK